MGCVPSREEMTENSQQPNLFSVTTTGATGKMLNGMLKICPSGIFLYERDRIVVHWPLKHVRRYGYGDDVFRFESGRRSESGPGVYTFKCNRANELFYLVHGFILETGSAPNAVTHGDRPMTSSNRQCVSTSSTALRKGADARRSTAKSDEAAAAVVNCRSEWKDSTPQGDLDEVQICPDGGAGRADDSPLCNEVFLTPVGWQETRQDESNKSRTYYINVYPDALESCRERQGCSWLSNNDCQEQAPTGRDCSYFQFLCQRLPSPPPGSSRCDSTSAEEGEHRERALNYVTLDVGNESATLQQQQQQSSDTCAKATGQQRNSVTMNGLLNSSNYAVIDYKKTKALHDTTVLQSRSAEECAALFRRNRLTAASALCESLTR